MRGGLQATVPLATAVGLAGLAGRKNVGLGLVLPEAGAKGIALFLPRPLLALGEGLDKGKTWHHRGTVSEQSSTGKESLKKRPALCTHQRVRFRF